MHSKVIANYVKAVLQNVCTAILKIHKTSLTSFAVGFFLTFYFYSLSAVEYPSSEELAKIRALAHENRFKVYVLQKLEVYSYVQEKRGLCFDFVGSSDGLYRSKFNSGPILIDMANCGEEADFIDGRIKPLKLLEAREHREGLTTEQVDHAIAEINALFADKRYDPKLKE